MSESEIGMLGVDTKPLAKALDAGIGTLKGTIPGLLPNGERLRHSICGLASTSLYLYLKSNNFRADLVVSQPELPFDEYMTHVFIVADDATGQHFIDPTYSQFLSYVNLHPLYESIVSSGLMPPEQIAVFDSQDRFDFTNRLTDIATAFQAVDPYSADERLRKFRIANGELAAASRDEIQLAYDAIWNPANIDEFSPVPYILEKAKRVANYMCRKLA